MTPDPRPGPVRGQRRSPGPLDLCLIALAGVYLAYVGLSGVGSEWYASADRIAEGKVWLLLTSGLNVVVELDEAQWALLALAVGAVIYRLGPRLWWIVALGGHVGSALIVYAAIEIAVALGSGSAEATAAEADYGVSIVLAASLGALTASALIARETKPEGMDGGDKVALAFGLFGLLGMIAVSFGWYDSEHLIGYAIGLFLTKFLVRRKVWGIGVAYGFGRRG